MEKPQISKKDIEIKVIYIMFKGTYLDFRKNALKMHKELVAFAEKNNLIIPNVTKIITIYHDNPFITKGTNLRTSMAMTVPLDSNYKEEGNISTMNISGKYAILHYNLSRREYDEAWKYSYHEWLFKSKEKPRDSFPFEMYITEPPRNAKDKSLTDIYIPLE
ncbi:MAG: GyrI-like domain-containing protein [Bacilli bacterium]|nr:GyrI-like domain-containing protein [Bacilli bacterium]